MEPIDKQTIDKLRAFETSYQEGAWEDFGQFRKKKKRRPLLILWRMAAGVILSIVIGWGVYKINQTKAEQAIVNQVKEQNDSLKALKPKDGNTTLSEKIVIDKKTTDSQKHRIKKPAYPLSIKEKLISHQKDEKSSQEAFTEEKNFQPEYLQSYTFNGILVRPKAPFIPPYPVNEPDESSKNKTHSLKLSIALAGSSNQAENVVAQQNFGLRGTTEIALSRRAELSTGIYVGQENLNLQNTVVPLSTPVGIPQLNQVNYRWLNVEIPLNVRYHVWQKGALTFSTQAGVSVMGAFNQTSQLFYENRRTVVLVSVGENGQVQELSTTFVDKEVKNNSSNAQQISLGTALNFSVGIHYPLGKNQLSVEPFFKYPIGAFTAEKLHYSSVGVQLRWSISAKSRK